MNEMTNIIGMRTPIEIALDIDSDGMTTARKVYQFLEFRKADLARWCKNNITAHEFATENEDWTRLFFDAETPTGGRIQREDYKLTAHFAKKLSVKGNSEKAEQAREYFTTVEERVKQKAIDRTQLSPNLQALRNLDVFDLIRVPRKPLHQIQTAADIRISRKAENPDQHHALQKNKPYLPLLFPARFQFNRVGVNIRPVHGPGFLLIPALPAAARLRLSPLCRFLTTSASISAPVGSVLPAFRK